MKPYGIPRVPELEWPDLADINTFGLQSSSNKLCKHGTIKNSFRSSTSKRSTRRYWKKRARQKGKQDVVNRINDQEENNATS